MLQLRRVSAGQVALLLILLLGLYLRLLYIQSPLLDAHRWRQVDTASIARLFNEDGLNPFYPEVAWGGAHGYTECEFPLLPFLTAVLYRVFGEIDWLGRVVAVAFSMGTVIVGYYLGRALLGRPAGRAFAFLLAVSPGAVFYGRAVMPDSVMLFFSISAVLGFVQYFRTGRMRALLLGSCAFALAGLAKLPALMVLAPIAGAAWHARGWRAWRDWRALVGIGAAMLVVAAWYAHAYLLFRQTGITFGILSHPARTYPTSVAVAEWPTEFTKWSTWTLLTTGDLYRTLFSRVYYFHLLPWGFAGALLGLLTWPRDRWPAVPALWVLAVVAFFLVAGGGNIGHDYYQLPVVLCGGLCFGAGAAPLFDGSWIAAHVRRGFAGPLLVAAVLVPLTLVSFYFSGVLDSHFRRNALDQRAFDIGSALGNSVDRSYLAVVVDDYGTTSPMMLYYAHMRGWSFDVPTLSPYLLEHLVRQYRARYFATSVWPEIEERRPQVADVLRRCRVIPIAHAPSGVRVFELDVF